MLCVICATQRAVRSTAPLTGELVGKACMQVFSQRARGQAGLEARAWLLAHPDDVGVLWDAQRDGVDRVVEEGLRDLVLHDLLEHLPAGARTAFYWQSWTVISCG